MACLNDIIWRLLSLLWASLDVVQLPDEWSLRNCRRKTYFMILGEFIVENLFEFMDNSSKRNVHVLIGGVILAKYVFASQT